MAETVEIGNMIYRPGTCAGGRYNGWSSVEVLKRAGKGRSRFSPPEGSLVPVKTIVYRDPETRDKALAERQGAADEWLRQKALRRAERSKPHAYKIGDILSCSWGYEQTNVDWYTATETTAHTVTLARIAGGLTDKETGNSMAGYSIPEMPVRIVGEERTKHRADERGSVRINSYSWAYLWDGREKYASWYA